MPQESPTTIDVPRELRIILPFACCDIQWPMSKGQATHFVALILTQSCALASVSMAVSNKQAAVFDDPPCLEQGHVRIEPTLLSIYRRPQPLMAPAAPHGYARLCVK